MQFVTDSLVVVDLVKGGIHFKPPVPAEVVALEVIKLSVEHKIAGGCVLGNPSRGLVRRGAIDLARSHRDGGPERAVVRGDGGKRFREFAACFSAVTVFGPGKCAYGSVAGGIDELFCSEDEFLLASELASLK